MKKKLDFGAGIKLVLKFNAKLGLFLCVFSLLTGSVFAQNNGVNSESPVPGSNSFDPATLPQLLQLASAALQKNDLAGAVDYYRRVIDLDPGNWQAYQNLAGCYLQLGEMSEARKAYKQCLAIHPNNPALIQFIVQHVLPVSQTPTATPTITSETSDNSPNGQLSLGAHFDGWNTNFSEATNGTEILLPMSASYNLSNNFNLYASSMFANGNYTYLGETSLNLSAFSDTTAGADIGFQTFSLNSILNVWFNIPTGNSAWESETTDANIPEQFVTDRYWGRGLGVSGFYGISIPVDSSKVGLAAGYIYEGDYNPNAGLSSEPTEDLKLGDSIFVSANRVTPTGLGQNDVIQVSAYFFLPTLDEGENVLWMGPNLNASYAWNDPSAFSFEVGAQVYLPGETAVNGQWVSNGSDIYGPRVYFNPSYAFGDFTLAAQFKYIFPNGYSPNDPTYGGLAYCGGYLLGIEPSYQLKLGGGMGLHFYAFYDYITAVNGGDDASGNLVNVLYGYWGAGTDYVIPF